jgi:TPR repeat protein
MGNKFLKLSLFLSLLGFGAFAFADDSLSWLAKGLDAQNNGDYSGAFQCFKISAESGVPKAEYELGYCYLTAQGVSGDDIEAVKWFRRSALQGDGRAEFAMGYCYENGWGVSKDMEKARQSYQKAAQEGFGGGETAIKRLEAATSVSAQKTVESPVLSAATSTYEDVAPAEDSVSNTVDAQAAGN